MSPQNARRAAESRKARLVRRFLAALRAAFNHWTIELEHYADADFRLLHSDEVWRMGLHAAQHGYTPDTHLLVIQADIGRRVHDATTVAP